MTSVIGKLDQKILVQTRNEFRDEYGGFDDVWYPALNNVSDITESGTTATNVKIVGHGLVTGDSFVNITRKAVRTITKVDSDNFTVLSVASQTTGDSCTLCSQSLSKIWAGFKSRNSSFIDENSQRKNISKHTVKIRFRNDISPSFRVTLGNRVFEIESFYNDLQSDNFIFLELRELIK